MPPMRWPLAFAFLTALIPTGALAQIAPPMEPTGPQTIHGYDSCEISVSPAATLLLPYFETDALSGR